MKDNFMQVFAVISIILSAIALIAAPVFLLVHGG